MKATVLFLNPDLTHAVPPQLLQGFSGNSYGVSRWNATYNCHAVELTLEAFDRCWQDVQRAVHLPMRRWFPRFSVEAQPVAVGEFHAGYEAGRAGEGLGAEASAAKRAGYEAGRSEREPETPAEPRAEGRPEDTVRARNVRGQRQGGRGKVTATVANGTHEVLQPE